MTSQEVLAILRQHADDLRARGIQHAALFVSVARGQADTDSDIDIDILIKLAPDAELDLWAYIGLKSYVAELSVVPWTWSIWMHSSHMCVLRPRMPSMRSKSPHSAPRQFA
jgi:uncharacterized protein